MKRLSLFFLSFVIALSLCLETSISSASTRAIKRVKVQTPTGDTKEIDLYSGYYALLIACADYRNGWPKLPNPVRDAKEVKGALEQLGFTVDLVENPDSTQLNRSLSKLPSGPGNDPQKGIFVFFAGHGHTLERADGTKLGYIVPVDAPDPDKNPAGFLEKAVSI